MSASLHDQLESIWRTPPGLARLTGVNHSTVGLRFIVTALIFFLIGGVLAMLIRSQLAFAGNPLLDHREYNAAFTLHGTAMMFFFAVPVMQGFATYLVPKMIGARDLVFPRLSAFGYWCYLFGGILVFSSVFVGEPPTAGWFMYVPLSSTPYSPGLGSDFWLLGITFAEISAVASAIELIVSILKTRAPGMTLDRMPLFVWAILVTAVMILFAFPPLILAGILLEVERAFGLPYFDPTRGGDALLWQHLFWFFGHPEVYLIFLPAAGIVSTIVPTFARRPMTGYRWIVVAFVSTAFVSFGLWVHHMYTTGIPLVALSFFSAASLAVAIPAGIQVFAWIATLWNGRPLLSVPLLYVFGFLFVFVLGGLTGVMLAMVPFDWQAHDTHFVVAHLHYVLFGGMVFPLFAGLYYWLPLVSGRRVSDTAARLAFWLIFAGFNLTFLPMHLTGLLGMPRRVYTYADGLGWELLNLISTVGGFLTAVGVAAFIIDLVLDFRFGKRAGENVWDAGTLEWAMPAPVPSYNFASQPVIPHREPLRHDGTLAARMQAGAFYLGSPKVKRREMLITRALTAEPEQVVVLPGNTWTPLVAALFTGVFFVAVLVKIYWLAIAGIVLSTAAYLVWAWQGGRAVDDQPVAIGNGKRLPLHYAMVQSPGWWGAVFSLITGATLFASGVFAYFFLWTVSPGWLPPPERIPDWALPAAALVLLALGTVAVVLREYTPAIVTGLLAGVLQIVALQRSDLSITAHAYDALVMTVWSMVLVHLLISLLMLGFAKVRASRSIAALCPRSEPAIAALFWYAGIAKWLVAFAVIHGAPLAAMP